MGNLRKLAGISIILILAFMVIALFRFQREEEMAFLPDQFEYYLNEGWTMLSLDSEKAAELRAQGTLGEWIGEAFEKGDSKEIKLPYKGESRAGDIIVYKNTLPQMFTSLTMGFSSVNASVRVMLDGEAIYEYGFSEGGIPQASPGSKEHIVSIPNEFAEGEMWIELTSPYQNAASVLGNVIIETRDMVIIGVMESSIVDISCCLLITIMAIIMFVLALIRIYTRQPARGEMFLGLAGLAAGFYCFIETDTLSVLYDVQEAYAMQEYLVLLIPMFLALYLDRNLHVVYPRRFFVLLCCVSLHAVVQIFLHILGIQRLENMVNISAAAVGVVCIAAIISLVQFYYNNRQYHTLLAVLSMVVLFSGGVANIIINAIFKDVRGNAAGQFSMAAFAILMAVMHILQLSKEYRMKAEENAFLLEEKVRATEEQNMQLSQAKREADAAKQEALAANEAKGKFLAHMSHEIRTPINAVLGMDEMILRESKEQSIKEYAMDIYTAGQTLLSLINDILDFSKIESGKMEIVPVEYDLSSLIHDLANMALQRAKAKDIRLEVEVAHDIPSRLYGDDVRIRQVLTNILTNAVKYTHEGTVWLRVRGKSEGRKATLWFEVEDTGIGIKEEDLPKLSAEFERIEEDRNRNIEGSGLGMSITIQILALLGSRLQVESVYGKGSKFYFELEQDIIDSTPIGDFESRVQQIAENYTYNARVVAPDAKLLMVDDNAVNRKVLRNLLKETQIQVEEAGGGEECLELVKKNHYDLIFLDHMMPGMDGVETLHHMKELSDYPCQDTPIVVLTANAVSGAKEKYLAEGFDDFLSKPVVPEKLEHMIRKMLPEELLKEAAAGLEAERSGQAGESAADALDELPQVDGLDWQYAWMHLPDMELLGYTVKEFYAQIDSAADNLEASYREIGEPDKLNQYRIQVHAMKSLAATIGLLPLSGVAKLLEYAARDGRIDVLLSMTEIFLEEWRSYKEKLRGVFGAGAEPKEEVTDYSVIQALVEMVRLSMQEMDIDQADQLMGQLKLYEYPDEMGKNIQKLSEAVTNLDPEETDRLAELLLWQMKG